MRRWCPPGRFFLSQPTPCCFPRRSARGRLRYRFVSRAASGAGTLLAEILDFWRTEDDGTETGIEPSRLGYPRILDTDGSADTLPVPPREKPVRFSLRLLAIGWNYTNFLEHAGRFPYRSLGRGFGIEAKAYSATSMVRLRPGPCTSVWHDRRKPQWSLVSRHRCYK